MKFSVLALLIAALPFNGFATSPAACSVTLTEDPLVMRIGKDEFRIAFGVNGEKCVSSGCFGSIEYRATWQTANGDTKVERKQLGYSIPGGASRSIAVDRHYFDTAEGKQTTSIVSVNVDQVSCAHSDETNLAKR